MLIFLNARKPWITSVRWHKLLIRFIEITVVSSVDLQAYSSIIS